MGRVKSIYCEAYLFYLTLETRVLPTEAADTRSEHSVTKILSKLCFSRSHLLQGPSRQSPRLVSMPGHPLGVRVLENHCDYTQVSAWKNNVHGLRRVVCSATGCHTPIT